MFLLAILAAMQQTRIRAIYNISGSIAGDCARAFLCSCCVLMRNDREIRSRELDVLKSKKTVAGNAVDQEPGLHLNMSHKPSTEGHDYDYEDTREHRRKVRKAPGSHFDNGNSAPEPNSQYQLPLTPDMIDVNVIDPSERVKLRRASLVEIYKASTTNNVNAENWTTTNDNYSKGLGPHCHEFQRLNSNGKFSAVVASMAKQNNVEGVKGIVFSRIPRKFRTSQDLKHVLNRCSADSQGSESSADRGRLLYIGAFDTRGWVPQENISMDTKLLKLDAKRITDDDKIGQHDKPMLLAYGTECCVGDAADVNHSICPIGATIVSRASRCVVSRVKGDASMERYGHSESNNDLGSLGKQHGLLNGDGRKQHRFDSYTVNIEAKNSPVVEQHHLDPSNVDINISVIASGKPQNQKSLAADDIESTAPASDNVSSSVQQHYLRMRLHEEAFPLSGKVVSHHLSRYFMTDVATRAMASPIITKTSTVSSSLDKKDILSPVLREERSTGTIVEDSSRKSLRQEICDDHFDEAKSRIVPLIPMSDEPLSSSIPKHAARPVPSYIPEEVLVDHSTNVPKSDDKPFQHIQHSSGSSGLTEDTVLITRYNGQSGSFAPRYSDPQTP